MVMDTNMDMDKAIATSVFPVGVVDSDPMQLLRILQLASPTLPVGAYAYSQGLEHAVDQHWLTDAESTQQWIIGVMQHAMVRVDLPVFSRLYSAQAEQQLDAFNYWNQYQLASRESSELQNEDLHLGNALLQLLSDLGVDSAVDHIDRQITYAAAFALACVQWNIKLDNGAAALLWSWADNQVAAATKLVPLGQTDGQRILVKCMECIPEAVSRGLAMRDTEIGFSSPALAIGSAHHEQQYSRLFRS
jgi:urease accessory protein